MLLTWMQVLFNLRVWKYEPLWETIELKSIWVYCSRKSTGKKPSSFNVATISILCWRYLIKWLLSHFIWNILRSKSIIQIAKHWTNTSKWLQTITWLTILPLPSLKLSSQMMVAPWCSLWTVFNVTHLPNNQATRKARENCRKGYNTKNWLGQSHLINRRLYSNHAYLNYLRWGPEK